MSKYTFSANQRFAVFTAHGQKCYMCSCMVDMQSMQIDHLIPEQLLDNPNHLKAVLDGLGRPNNFDLNSYENWLPSCGPCNAKKGSTVFDASPLVQIQLQKAANKAETAKKLENDALHNATLTKAINTVCRANEKTMLTKKQLEPLISSFKKHNPDLLKGFHQNVDSKRPAEISLTPFHKVVMEDERILMVYTPYGIGYIPKGDRLDISFSCGYCGSLGPWNGARSLTCGYLSDD